MATGKRQPSKQKRTNQNRQQRSALEARKAAASAPAPTGSSSSGGRSGGGLLGRLRGAMAPAPASARTRPSPSPRTSVPTGAGDGGDPLTRNGQPVGYRAAMTGLIAAVAAVGISFILSTPVTQDGDPYTSERVVAEWADTALRTARDVGGSEPDAVVDEIGVDWMPNRDTERLAIAAFPASLAMVLPIIGAYFAFRAVQQRRGSRIVNRAMYATLFGAVLTFGLLTFFLPTVIAVGVAGFQVRKAETTAAMAEARAEADDDDDGGDDDEIIEAEVVDEDDDADAK